MTYSRKTISNQGDRQAIELGEARILYGTWLATQKSVLTRDRMEYLEKRFGSGSVQRIRDYMNRLRTGELE
jgi:hypothetical protein